MAPSVTATEFQTAFHREDGWSVHDVMGTTVWVKGGVWDGGRFCKGAALAERCRSVSAKDAPPAAAAAMDGHFAAAILEGGEARLIADRIMSTPVFHGTQGDRTVIGNRAGEIASTLGLGRGDIDPLAALEIAQAGFTIGRGTLFRAVDFPRPGQMLRLAAGRDPVVINYAAYRPWQALAGGVDTDQDDLAEVTLTILRKLVDSVDSRPILVPLSAGMDSRLIVSGLAHIGYRDVHCVSYGLPGNREATVAKGIAERLGYRWTMLPARRRAIRTFAGSDFHQACRARVDSLFAIPNLFELPAFHQAKVDGVIPDDAVVVNGQSGDFIAGAHIPAGLAGLAGRGPNDWRMLVDAYAKKHFGLWSILNTDETAAHLDGALRAEAARLGAPVDDSNALPFVYEALEFEHRQARYVIQGQRSYECLGLDWRLPLWDPAYLDFWEQAPLSAKFRQNLYRDMLLSRNWGGVWDGFKRTHSMAPLWARAMRTALKAMHAPLGRERWHRFDRSKLDYWQSTNGSYWAFPYGTVAADRRGFRNAVSWWAERYLQEHGIGLNHVMQAIDE